MTIRCGLFGISTYSKELPEATVADYFQACQNAGEPDKALDFARKVVGVAPDFSWGWSAIETAAFNALVNHPPDDQIAALRSEGLRAADKAISLDRSNSEAYAFKAQLMNSADLVGRQRLFNQAIHARTLPCGCEHHFYGDFLTEVGRNKDAVDEYERAIDIMALNSNTQMSLVQALLYIGRADLAKPHLDSALALDDDPRTPGLAKVTLAPMTADYAGAIKALNDPDRGPPPEIRIPLTSAFAALASKSQSAKTAALAKIKAMPAQTHGGLWVQLVAMLGDNRDAIDATVAAALDAKRLGARGWLFTPPLAGALRDPSFPAAAERLGLINYWRTTHTKPDVCRSKGPPPFCKLI
jgi:tetratricopeptide (TPR) repeat protein